MTPPILSARWWKAVLGIRSDRQIVADVLHEPGVRRARRLIRQADRLLAKELAAIEDGTVTDE